MKYNDYLASLVPKFLIQHDGPHWKEVIWLYGQSIGFKIILLCYVDVDAGALVHSAKAKY